MGREMYPFLLGKIADLRVAVGAVHCVESRDLSQKCHRPKNVMAQKCHGPKMTSPKNDIASESSGRCRVVDGLSGACRGQATVRTFIVGPQFVVVPQVPLFVLPEFVLQPRFDS
jgi:hypothetical protein